MDTITWLSPRDRAARRTLRNHFLLTAAVAFAGGSVFTLYLCIVLGIL
jgi:hypothetical protein